MSDVKLPELVGSKKNYIILDLKRYEDSLSKMSVRVHRQQDEKGPSFDIFQGLNSTINH